jgi:hypothetical protein
MSRASGTLAILTRLAELIQSLKLKATWEEDVRKLLHDEQSGPDPDTERKDIRNTLRLMRENYEHGLYEGEEYQYWQKVSALKEKLALLERVPEPAINRAAQTLLDLREPWENTTEEKRRDLVRMMIEEVGVDVVAKNVIWIKARPDFDVLFQLLNNLRMDQQRRFWIAYPDEVDGEVCDIREDFGQVGPKSKSPSRCLTTPRQSSRSIKMKGNRLNVEIAQQALSDLGFGNHALA